MLFLLNTLQDISFTKCTGVGELDELFWLEYNVGENMKRRSDVIKM